MGGGGGSNGDGGTDGSYGCCGGESGIGSSFNLSSIQLDTFTLSSGTGGEQFLSVERNVGGGGGGVLVDGEGAQDDSIRPECNGQGYGFGAGASSGVFGYGQGGQGVVLMEVTT